MRKVYFSDWKTLVVERHYDTSTIITAYGWYKPSNWCYFLGKRLDTIRWWLERKGL